jgi:hypothetical protein
LTPFALLGDNTFMNPQPTNVWYALAGLATLTVFGIIGFIFTTPSFWFSHAETEPSIIESPSPATRPFATPISTTGWKTYSYTHPTLKFSLQLPPDWTILPKPEDKDSQVYFTKNGLSTGNSFILGPAKNLVGYKPNEDHPTYIADTITGFIGFNGMTGVVDSPDIKEEHAGRMFLYRKRNGWTSEVAVPLLYKNYDYYLILNNWTPDYNPSPMLDAILSTITFVK